MKFFRKFALALVITLLLVSLFPGCAAKPKEATLTVAYQYGISYAPMVVMRDQNLIEKHYGSKVNVEWKVISSGAEINEGIIAGEIDVACMGIAPFITGVSKGVPYKLFSALSGQPMGLNTNNPDIKSLADFSPDDKIAVPSYGSIQHILLAMAAEKEFGDSHAMDQQIVNMSHPDGMQALLTKSVTAHLTIAPYYNMEIEAEGIHEIRSVTEKFPENCTVIIGAALNKLFEENRKLYDAVVDATQEAVDYINNNPREAAELLCENEGVSADAMEGYLNHEKCVYTTIPNGLMEIAGFMGREGFTENVPSTLGAFCFEDLLGRIQEEG